MLGLRKKRAMLSGEHATLSELLREAKEKYMNVQETQGGGQATGSATSLNYSVLFDEYEGMYYWK